MVKVSPENVPLKVFSSFDAEIGTSLYEGKEFDATKREFPYCFL